MARLHCAGVKRSYDAAALGGSDVQGTVMPDELRFDTRSKDFGMVVQPACILKKYASCCKKRSQTGWWSAT